MNPYRPPGADLSGAGDDSGVEYVGFWARVGASIIDSIILMLVTAPLLYLVYGREYFLQNSNAPLIYGPADVLISYLLPAIAIILFWVYKSATPGKMVIGAKIVDSRSGGRPSTGQLVGRYLGYFVSLLPFGLGCLWVAFDPRKQGWHDKLAGTLVVRRSAAEDTHNPGSFSA